MFTEKHFLNSITGEELDEYLGKGWYRLGQIMFTCHFLFFEDNLYSPIWTRLPIKNHVFKKRLRKIIRRVEKAFRVEIGEGKITDPKNELYEKYRRQFKGQIAPNLKNSLQDNQDFNIYNTKQVEIFHGDKLIAFSFFDVGLQSIASIKGVYDPDYSTYSLGLYTMLVEIKHGQEKGIDYYYPGYIVPGYPRFDYKLRIGKRAEMEFYDLKRRTWQSFTKFTNEIAPVELLSAKLLEVGWQLSEIDVSCQMLYYPAYEASIFGYENEKLLKSPLFLNIFCTTFPQPRFIVFYDIWEEKYVFCHCMTIEDLGFYFEYSIQFDTRDARHFLDFILKKTKIIETEDIGAIVKLAKNISQLLKKPKAPNRLLKK